MSAHVLFNLLNELTCGILTCVDSDEPLQLLSLETPNGVQSVA